MGLIDKMAKAVIVKSVASSVVDITLKTVEVAADAVACYQNSRGIVYVYAPISADSCLKRNCQEIQAQFLASGFLHVTSVPKKDLIKGWLTKNNSIEEISIDGKQDFPREPNFALTPTL